MIVPDLGPEALAGIKVLDLATLFAGPLMATILGDFGADVLKIEHPRGDPARTHGPSKDGVALWWAQLARNKRCLSLYLGASASRLGPPDTRPDITGWISPNER